MLFSGFPSLQSLRLLSQVFPEDDEDSVTYFHVVTAERLALREVIVQDSNSHVVGRYIVTRGQNGSELEVELKVTWEFLVCHIAWMNGTLQIKQSVVCFFMEVIAFCRQALGISSRMQIPGVVATCLAQHNLPSLFDYYLAHVSTMEIACQAVNEHQELGKYSEIVSRNELSTRVQLFIVYLTMWDRHGASRITPGPIL